MAILLEMTRNLIFRHNANSYKPVRFYNLNVFISVGYRIKLQGGTSFRSWATKRLNEYIRKDFTIDDDFLKILGGYGYWS